MHLTENIIKDIKDDNLYTPRAIWQYCLEKSKKIITWDKYSILMNPCSEYDTLTDLIRDKEQILTFNIYEKTSYLSNKGSDDKESTLVFTRLLEDDWKDYLVRLLNYANTIAVIIPEGDYQINSFEDNDLVLIHSEKLANEEFDTKWVFNIYEKRNNLIDSLLKKYFGR